MNEYRVVALSQQTVDEVRNNLRAPGYGHPAHVEMATGHGPCRLCLDSFRTGEEERVLFTYNPFPKPEMPCPGPSSCTRPPAPATRAQGSRRGYLGFP